MCDDCSSTRVRVGPKKGTKVLRPMLPRAQAPVHYGADEEDGDSGIKDIVVAEARARRDDKGASSAAELASTAPEEKEINKDAECRPKYPLCPVHQ